MEQSIENKIRAAAREFVLETFTESTEKDYLEILNGMLKAAEDLLPAVRDFAPEATEPQRIEIIVKAVRRAAHLVFKNSMK